MSGLLLDTQIFLWLANEDAKLSESAASRIQREEGSVCASVVSVWEIAIKFGLGKLKMDLTVSELIRGATVDAGIELIPITAEDLQAYSELPLPASGHRDPFDRMLVVQARLRGLSIMTTDQALKAYSVPVELV